MKLKKKIGFVCEWGSDRENCWSGTPYGVFCALQNYYDVVDYHIEFSFFEKLLTRFKKILRKIFKINFDFESEYIDKVERHLKRFKIEEKAVIMFSGFNSLSVERSYVYQDLTMSYLADMYTKNNELIKFTPLANVASDTYLKKALNNEKQFYANCKGLFVMSQWLCDYMKHTGVISPEKVHFVGAGCNIDFSKSDMSKRKGNKFLFVGKDFERKNGFLVVEAFKIFHREHPDSELYLVGPQSKEDCGELGEGIIFVGRKSYNELIYYYNLCDYFVMPSQFEAYGIVFGEALIFGLPCIGKNCFAMPEFIDDGENGFLIDKNDKYELANKMLALYKNETIINNVRLKQSEYIKKYSWQATAERIYNVLEANTH